VDGFPGRYRRSHRIQQCTTGVSADNKLSIVMKHLFRDIVSSELFAGSFKDKYSTILECHRFFFSAIFFFINSGKLKSSHNAYLVVTLNDLLYFVFQR
jgi:hypothetical protein